MGWPEVLQDEFGDRAAWRVLRRRLVCLARRRHRLVVICSEEPLEVRGCVRCDWTESVCVGDPTSCTPETFARAAAAIDAHLARYEWLS